MTGILLSDYFLVRKRHLDIEDLYIGSQESIYWYFHGFNWRSFAAWALALWPLLRTSTPVFPLIPSYHPITLSSHQPA